MILFTVATQRFRVPDVSLIVVRDSSGRNACRTDAGLREDRLAGPVYLSACRCPGRKRIRRSVLHSVKHFEKCRRDPSTPTTRTRGLWSERKSANEILDKVERASRRQLRIITRYDQDTTLVTKQ